MNLTALLEAATEGDQMAWDEIVDRFSGLVWAVTRAHRLSTPAAADVVQTTWLRLVENLDRITDPERLGAWLATTARRECLREIRLGTREVLTSDDQWLDEPLTDAVDARLLTRERDDALRRALAKIEERCQALLRLLAMPQAPSYEEIGAALDMPVGAIGPTRARCLDKLRRRPELAGFVLG